MSNQSFFHACGGREPIRVAVAGTELTFAQPVIVAGSDRQCDIVLPDCPEIAIIFTLVDGCVFAVPRAADQHITLAGSPLQPCWLAVGDTITCHGTTLQVFNPHQPGSTIGSKDPLHSGGVRTTDLSFEPIGRFRDRNGNENLSVLPRLMIMGRDEPARFRVNLDGVEPLHALIIRTPGGPWLADLVRRQSTCVNDAAILHAPLRDGDRVTLGSVQLVTRLGGDSRPVPAMPAAVAVPSTPTDAAIGPILQQVANFQQQTFDQFRAMLGSVTEMFGAVLSEHREFVREEFARLERSAAAPGAPQLPAAPAAPPPPPPKPFTPPETITPVMQPAPGYSAPPPDVGLHTWLQEQLHGQLGNLEKVQESRWQKLVEKFRKK